MNKQRMVLLSSAIVAVFLFADCKTAKSWTDHEARAETSASWIPFHWSDPNKSAIYLSVTIDDIPRKLTMQFDLGANVSLFYENALAPFLEAYPSLAGKLDRIADFSYFYPISLRFGDVVLDELRIFKYGNFGEQVLAEELDSDKNIDIGTIGSDIFQDKILIIDFPSQRLCVTEQMPLEYQTVAAETGEIRNNRMLFPFLIDGQRELLMFDTGSSVYPLLTIEENALSIGGSLVDVRTATSWGTDITLNGHEIVKDVSICGKSLKGKTVYYNTFGSTDDFIVSEGIWGITGNILFLDNIVILDYKNKTIRII
ncbi:MAG: hypothetical protein LBJ41_03310 [Treponema sp.]|jgi:hypothetical protein|nr:hypothetical protein [Treponema sp.]